MKKTIIAALSISFGLAGGLAATSTTANAKTVSGMPSSLCHTWHRGKWSIKFAKHYLWSGKTGHKALRFHFKHVLKRGSAYSPEIMSDVGVFKYAHGYMYANDGAGWERYHR